VADYNVSGKWSVEEVQKRYASLREATGLAPSGVDLQPRVFRNDGGYAWIYSVMERVADGLLVGDEACIELSIDYIVDDIFHTTSGYIRARMARRLKHVVLTDAQQDLLRAHFMNLLREGETPHELREYTRLFVRIGPGPHLPALRELAASPPHPRAKTALTYLQSKFMQSEGDRHA
jgi:hypothetical protein